ncbi:VOC family protein [Haliangium ochraceum]|uniref:Glyoxalase/bleomycin resistance protein/dioxygenase n=1 Tax=Haliangium ochraceum (strain DSM 14365 / JCM 11303 / SMP-2) TaxID=502025 RepID=D0LJ99_HALO1|nr:VOC family protein [Haliangium ochraceum]ACY14946.1 Glyoxalase/bleomycin resistance protein/dioxygenase [Haliangium ochraceum DSM 14365]
MSDIRGRFLWFELLTRDPATAEAFYAESVGWGTRHERDDDGERYSMFTAKGQPVAGFLSLPPGQCRSHWMAYIGSRDVDADALKAAHLGGEVLVAPMDIPGVGRFSLLGDPQGALFALLRPRAPTQSAGAPCAGEFAWCELGTRDWQRVWSFYEALFAWQRAATIDMGAHGSYQCFRIAGSERQNGGMHDLASDPPTPGRWLFYVRVDDIDAAVERALAAGGALLRGPMEVPGGDRVAQLSDPQGAAFAVSAPA